MNNAGSHKERFEFEAIRQKLINELSDIDVGQCRGLLFALGLYPEYCLPLKHYFR
jgi:hypothetical protein